jgi:Carboxypeptidase regulatory-like domain
MGGVAAASVVMAGLLIAGCADARDAVAGLPVDDKGAPLPTLYGVVVDGSIRPLAGAVVRFLGSEANATTDADGRYEIHRPTRQAEVVLAAAYMPGFVPLTHQVQVSGHVSARSDFVLEIDAYTVPHVDVLKREGTLGCRARLSFGGVDQPVSCDQPNPTAPNADPQASSSWQLDPTPGLAGLVVEVHWTAATDLSRQLHASLWAPLAGGPRGVTGDLQAETSGESPLRLEVPEETARGFPRWSSVVLFLRLADHQGDAPLGLSVDQGYEAFATLFYVDPAPAGYTLP